MAQKLLTKAIERAMPALYATESVPLAEKVVRAKWFNPCGAGTWYAVEGQPTDEGDDWLFFGLVRGHEWEWGYWLLSELASVRLRFGLRIERDIHFEPASFAQVQRSAGIPEEVLR